MSVRAFFRSPVQAAAAQTSARSRLFKWQNGLLLIVVAAALMRLLSYQFSLPYVDHLDEPNKYLGGLEWRGLYDSGGYYTGYPPGYLVINVAAQHALEALGKPGMAETVRALRLLSWVADLFTIVLIAKTVKLAGSGFSALLAAAGWAAAPIVLENNVYALPDPLNATLAALALWLAANPVLVEGRGLWCVGSVAAGLLATLLKYPAIPIIIPGGVAALILFVRHPKHGLRYLLLEAAVVTGTLGWLFLIYGVPLNSVEREGAVIRSSGLTNVFDVTRIAGNFYGTFLPLNPLVVALIIGLAVIALLITRRRNHRPQLLIALLCLSLLLSVPWLVSAYTVVQADYRMRDVLPATAAVCVLLGLAVDRILFTLPDRRRIPGMAGIAGALLLFVYGPQLARDIALVQQRRLPDLRIELRQWFDVNLEPGTVIVDKTNNKTFNPLWGGLPYRTWFDWWETDDIMEHSVSEWRDERGMSYAVLTWEQQQAMQSSAEGQAYLAEMLHLRDFVPPYPVRGPKMVAYRLGRMAHEADVRFGEHIHLIGYDQSSETTEPGGSIDFRFYWNAPSAPAGNYSLFIHLVPLDEYQVLAQFDGAPGVPERLTLTWTEPSETLISPLLSLTIPTDLAPGTYRVMIGLYDFSTGQRLAVTNGTGDASAGDAYELSRLDVR